MNNAAIRQVRTPEARRPIASEIQEQKKRPATAARLTQIASFDASGGDTCSTMTNSVTIQRVSPTPPVCVRPVRQPATRLRGYLNSSIHLVCLTTGGTAGREIDAGSTCNAHAIERRASSTRPMRINQCGDSGTHARIYKVSA